MFTTMQHKDAGLEIMAFPCNQFGRQVCPISTWKCRACSLTVSPYQRRVVHGLTLSLCTQEPGSNSEIQAFAASKGATFPVFRKVKWRHIPLSV